MENYGFSLWPSDVIATVSGWLSDDTQIALATAGISVGPDIYDSWDEQFLTPPKSLSDAYTLSSYFLAVAARRADYEGETAANAALYSAMTTAVTNKTGDIGYICQITGYGCRGGGRIGVITDTIDAIKVSGLNTEDQIKLTTMLKKIKRPLVLRSALKVAGLSTVLAGIGYLVYRKL